VPQEVDWGEPRGNEAWVFFGPIALIGSINAAKGFRLLQAEASHMEVTTRGPHLAQHLVDGLRNIVLFSCPHVYLSNLSGFRKSSRRSNWR
jgi:hypothetical protein